MSKIINNKLQYFEEISEHLELPVWEWHIPEDFMVGNKQVFDIYGFKKNESINQQWEKNIHPNDRSRVKKALAAHLKDNSVKYDVRYRYTHPILKNEFVIRSRGKLVKKDAAGLPLVMAGFSEVIHAATEKCSTTTSPEITQQTLFVLDSVDEIVFVSDPINCDILYMNKRARVEFGVEDNKLGSKCDKIIQHNKDICNICKKHRDTGINKSETFIWEFQNKTNKQWYRCSDKFIKWYDGRDVKLEIAFNITAEKEIKDLLKKSDERYRLVNEALNNGIWDWWVKNDHIFLSDQWKAQLGYERHELEDHYLTWMSLLHPEDKERVTRQFHNFITASKVKDIFVTEYRMLHKDGSYCWIQNKASIKIDETGKVVRMLGVQTDISRQKAAEDKIKQTDLMYRKLIENAPDGIVILDDHARFSFVSDSAARIFGYNLNEIVDASPDKYIHPDNLALFYETVNALLTEDSQKTPTISYLFLSKKKGWIWLESTFSLLNKEKDFPFVIINFRDISERIKFEEELIQARKNAESANIHKNQFLANMSHEIRTPMNGVVGFAELLKDKNISEEERIQYLDIIDINSKKLLALIDDIIDVAKIESGELSISLEDFDLNKMLNNILIVANKEKENQYKNDVEIILSVPDPRQQMIINSDELRLGQVFINLINNAIKFTDTGIIEFGYIVLKDSKKIKFFVKDDGIGIPKHEIDTIFQRFMQASNNETAKHGGTGLGLAICSGIIDLLNGSISVRSEESKGTIFEFTLPFNKIKMNISNLTSVSSHNMNSIVRGKKILIAEDDYVNQEYFKAVLRGLDLDIIIASDGEKAVQIALENPDIDIIFMDIRMPIMNGYEAASKIMQERPDAIIIAQTAYAMPDERKRCIDCGCKAYIVKPIMKANLFDLLKTWLQ